MKTESFTVLDTGGDVGLHLTAPDLSGLFRSAAAGLCSLITDPESVLPVDQVYVSLEAGDREELLVSWVNELIFLLDTRDFLARRADIISLSDTQITATLHGEVFQADRHERRLLVKAATYHGLFIRKTAEGLDGEVVLDL